MTVCQALDETGENRKRFTFNAKFTKVFKRNVVTFLFLFQYFSCMKLINLRSVLTIASSLLKCELIKSLVTTTILAVGRVACLWAYV